MNEDQATTQRIEAARLRRDLPVCTMMELAGISSSTWFRRVRGARWRTRHLSAIAGVLRVPVEELTGAAS